MTDHRPMNWLYIASIRNCFYFMVPASNTFLVLSEDVPEADIVWSTIRPFFVEMMMKTTSAVCPLKLTSKRHSYSEFSFLATWQHSFTRFYLNSLFTWIMQYDITEQKILIYLFTFFKVLKLEVIQSGRQTEWQCWKASLANGKCNYSMNN